MRDEQIRRITDALTLLEYKIKGRAVERAIKDTHQNMGRMESEEN